MSTTFGQRIIGFLASIGAVNVAQPDPEVSHTFVWSAAAPDQLEGFIATETGFTMPPSSGHQRHGRRKPYFEIGIRRLPCYRCGEPARQQWSACADKNLFRPLCNGCDAALNELALRFMGDPDVSEKMRIYRKKLNLTTP